MLKKLVPTILATLLIAGASRARAAARLQGESSAFLRSFADSPVDWMPWGEAAMARANISEDQIDEVIFGNVLGAGLGQNVASRFQFRAL